MAIVNFLQLLGIVSLKQLQLNIFSIFICFAVILYHFGGHRLNIILVEKQSNKTFLFQRYYIIIDCNKTLFLIKNLVIPIILSTPLPRLFVRV